MGNTSSLQASKWDDLFQALTRPDDLKAYLVRNLQPEGTRQSALHRPSRRRSRRPVTATSLFGDLT